ncbi:MAG TPA: AbrB/MazE/SpoVT family DNA-binding domain-containing protein [Kofleriaceae bacterium]|nr:AbrB/MazE/SpoVT family DNA-binding domain-containing protein [Kofleriaceae bacterium]
MARRVQTVRLSSKGQVVIPARLRRALGLKTGQPLTIRQTGPGEVTLSRPDRQDDAADMLDRVRASAAALAVDPVEELHRRRARERVLAARKHGARRP